jgi:hypothetical protein
VKHQVNNTRQQHRAFVRRIATGLVAGLMAVPALAFAHGGDSDLCSATSKAAKQACRYEVKNDFWIAIGNCSNLSSKDARRECRAEAAEERRSSSGDCRDQFDARQELCEALGGGPYDPVVDPANFLDPSEIAAQPNPLFPLVPGRQWVYEGDGETITVTVTDRTKEILGVECIVVRDVAEEDGEVTEDTDDWYTQDLAGNVWYFGEISKNFEDGELVDIEGSWLAGVEGAKPGILMKSAPQVGDVYRQEFALGESEDAGEVVSTSGSATVPAASCDGSCVVIKDFTPIEPDAAEHKYYAPGVGLILEVDLETGDRVELIEIVN